MFSSHDVKCCVAKMENLLRDFLQCLFKRKQTKNLGKSCELLSFIVQIAYGDGMKNCCRRGSLSVWDIRKVSSKFSRKHFNFSFPEKDKQCRLNIARMISSS